MSWLNKKSKTRFIRDSSGKVIAVEQEGDTNESTVFDKAAKNRQVKKEVRQRERQEHRYEQKYQKEKERQAFRKAYNEARIKRKTHEGYRAGESAFNRVLPPRRVVVVHTGKKQGKGKQGKQQHRVSVQKKKKMLPPDQWANNMMKKWGW